jgi:hypothetical protein
MNRSDAWERFAQCRRLQPDALQVLVSADIVDALLDSPAGLRYVHPLLQTARGMCADEDPYERIDALLAAAVDAVKDLEATVVPLIAPTEEAA